MTRKIEVTCDTLLSQMSSYLDGDLPELTCAAIEQHAASCPKCGRVIAEFRTATGLCRSAANAPLPEDVRARARERVRALIGREKDL
jgi:anti-sigma factor (TIGR02949 family)